MTEGRFSQLNMLNPSAALRMAEGFFKPLQAILSHSGLPPFS